MSPTEEMVTCASNKRIPGKETPPDASLLDNIVFVHVGPEKKVFGVHKGLICHYSYFNAAFGGNFKEAEDGVVILDDEEPETFSHFYSWLYTGRVMDANDHREEAESLTPY